MGAVVRVSEFHLLASLPLSLSLDAWGATRGNEQLTRANKLVRAEKEEEEEILEVFPLHSSPNWQKLRLVAAGQREQFHNLSRPMRALEE